MRRHAEVEALHVAIESVQVLRGLSLDVPAGTMVGLVGRNGAGKTTLMRAVMGLSRERAAASPSTATTCSRCRRHAPRRARHRLHARGPPAWCPS